MVLGLLRKLALLPTFRAKIFHLNSSFTSGTPQKKTSEHPRSATSSWVLLGLQQASILARPPPSPATTPTESKC